MKQSGIEIVVVSQIPIPSHAGMLLVIHHIMRDLIVRHEVQALAIDNNNGSELSDCFLSFRRFATESPG
jgi:hypothetical protein